MGWQKRLVMGTAVGEHPPRRGARVLRRALYVGKKHLEQLRSISQDLKFSDVPAGCFASLEAIPTAGWLQIMLLTCMQETGMGFASKPQADDAEAGEPQHTKKHLVFFPKSNG